MDINKLEELQSKILKSGRTRSEAGKFAKTKGKSGERKIVNLLNKYSGATFARIPNSGAFIGKTNRDNIFKYTEEMTYSMLGDIYPPEHFKKRFIIESKNYSSFPFKKLEKEEAPTLLIKWIEEIQYDTETYFLYKEKYNLTRNPLSFLVFNITNQGIYITYNKSYFLNEGFTLNPQYKIKHKEQKDLLKKYGFSDIWYIEDFKQFMINNQEKLFQ